MKTQVIIYSRPGCHLCEEALTAIQAAGLEHLYTLQEVNIEDDPELLARYQYEIPVITLDGLERFRHRITAQEFVNTLVQMQP